MPQQRRGRTEVAPEQQSAPVVAKRLCDLLLTFPSSAAGGVQWQVLSKKYEERHQARLDVTILGHTTALGAASALLWDVLRLVDTEDADNPVVAVEDGVALTPQPGLLGCWPSLYQAFCSIVSERGTADAPSSSSMLLSQLRPLLERHWHASFDETSLGFRSEEGTFVRLKKMKHLLTALIRWREERRAWQRASGLRPTAVDEVLVAKLELVPSKKHNDLVLVCTTSQRPTALPGSWGAATCLLQEECDSSSVSTPTSASSGRGRGLHSELERLRAENEELRAKNLRMQEASRGVAPVEPQLPADLLDDPFEPPPERRFWLPQEACAWSRGSFSDFGSTDAGSFSAGSATPPSSVRKGAFMWSSHSTSSCASGAETPAQHAQDPQLCHTMMPMWFPVMSVPAVDVSIIPRGIVQSARQQFERIAGQ